MGKFLFLPLSCLNPFYLGAEFSSISRRIPWKQNRLILPSQEPSPPAPGITSKEKVLYKEMKVGKESLRCN